MEHLWISQVLNTSLHTCHDLITPLTRHNLTKYGCFAWTSMALQTSSVRPNIYRSDTSTSGITTAPMAYMILCVRFTNIVRVMQSSLLKSITLISLLRQRRNTRYRWLVKPYLTGTYTLQDASSFA